MDLFTRGSLAVLMGDDVETANTGDLFTFQGIQFMEFGYSMINVDFLRAKVLREQGDLAKIINQFLTSASTKN